MSTFTILLAGDLTVTPRLRRQIAESTVIAADGGMAHAKSLEVRPSLWVGDFDSASKSLQTAYGDVPRETFPIDKDATDGALAVRFALERGARRLILCGALRGERSDHMLLHMTLALALAKDNCSVLLTAGVEEALPVLPGACTYDFPNASVFSVIGFSDLKGLSLDGARWPLRDHDVALGSSLTLSNHVCGTLKLGLRSGEAMIAVRLPVNAV
ncbi:thiamine diphosphokinase [Bartonella sp. DGB2]|uniref:thiamine diphosphokinase n=1 Tax=Bartonella sp. DGB2 TaxID=3388426 RepID=UPI0039901F46